MKYNIRQPQSFSEIGRKDNQEDYLWPSPESVTTQQRIFIMCDGVGGQESGEVASMTAATALGTFLTDNWPSDGVVTKSLFESALEKAYDALDDADHSDSYRKMATTMTCAVLHRGGALVAHIGDSRIYIVRPERVKEAALNSLPVKEGIIYESSDHSLVNDLLRIGELTEEEARNFPQKNVITRAMQPHGERRCRADIYNITDLQSGDYLFLCSDGVLEQLTDEQLCAIVADKTPDAEKISTILSICEGRTRDNHTCWLVPIEEVTAEPDDEQRAIPLLPKPRVPKTTTDEAPIMGTSVSGPVTATAAHVATAAAANATSPAAAATTPAAANATTPAAAATTGHTAATATQENTYTSPPGRYETPKPDTFMHKGIIWAASIVLALALGGGGVWYYFKHVKQPQDTPEHQFTGPDKSDVTTPEEIKNSKENQQEILDKMKIEAGEDSSNHRQNQSSLNTADNLISGDAGHDASGDDDATQENDFYAIAPDAAANDDASGSEYNDPLVSPGSHSAPQSNPAPAKPQTPERKILTKLLQAAKQKLIERF